MHWAIALTASATLDTGSSAALEAVAPAHWSAGSSLALPFSTSARPRPTPSTAAATAKGSQPEPSLLLASCFGTPAWLWGGAWAVDGSEPAA